MCMIFFLVFSHRRSGGDARGGGGGEATNPEEVLVKSVRCIECAHLYAGTTIRWTCKQLSRKCVTGNEIGIKKITPIFLAYIHYESVPVYIHVLKGLTHGKNEYLKRTGKIKRKMRCVDVYVVKCVHVTMCSRKNIICIIFFLNTHLEIVFS